jgi:glycosyltransferase involved in cell wall biosynthesis
MEGLFNKFMTYLSVVVPVYNECSLIEELIRRIKSNVDLITEDFEIIIIDDGSQDNTWLQVKREAAEEIRIKGIKFSRNFGHHYAITAGLHSAKGDWVVVMDGDLQDRPEVIPELHRKAQEGYDVVFVSRKNRPEHLLYKIIQKIFYWLLRTLSGINFDSKQANFSIISRKVVEAFKIFPENARFYGSTIKWLGFNRSLIFADHGQRFSGKPSYTIKKRFKLAFDIILAFSERPLKFAIIIGIFMSIISITIAGWIGFELLRQEGEVPVFMSLIGMSLFSTGLILILLGVIGIYIGRIFTEVKNRPLSIVEDRIN